MNVRDEEHVLRDARRMPTEDTPFSRLPSIDEAKKKFLHLAMSCPFCKTPPEQLSWVYLVVPQWTHENFKGGKGWLTICNQCDLQINFFTERG